MTDTRDRAAWRNGLPSDWDAANAKVFHGQMTWPCLCGDPKSAHYFGDRLGADGRMHTWCQRCGSCTDFRPAARALEAYHD